MLLGVHCSVAGGLENAFEEARLKGINTFQIFSRNQRQWKAKPVSDEERRRFSAAFKKSNIKVVFSHCSYLLNLASANEALQQLSVHSLTEEVERCSLLGLSFCVLHPGAAGEQPKEQAIRRIISGLRQVIKNTRKSKVVIALENTAGQGTSVGGTFENLRYIYEEVESKRIGFCLDTCHAFVAGYDIRTEKGVEKTLNSFDKICGLKHLKAFHINDSKGDLGSRLDRHENIGKGKLGLIPFKYIMNHFPHIPKVLETPKEEDGDEINLKVLRNLID
jgi:deoxyribonuclease-4